MIDFGIFAAGAITGALVMALLVRLVVLPDIDDPPVRRRRRRRAFVRDGTNSWRATYTGPLPKPAPPPSHQTGGWSEERSSPWPPPPPKKGGRGAPN